MEEAAAKGGICNAGPRKPYVCAIIESEVILIHCSTGTVALGSSLVRPLHQ